jgi:hypothetical protein
MFNEFIFLSRWKNGPASAITRTPFPPGGTMATPAPLHTIQYQMILVIIYHVVNRRLDVNLKKTTRPKRR